MIPFSNFPVFCLYNDMYLVFRPLFDVLGFLEISFVRGGK